MHCLMRRRVCTYVCVPSNRMSGTKYYADVRRTFSDRFNTLYSPSHREGQTLKRERTSREEKKKKKTRKKKKRQDKSSWQPAAGKHRLPDKASHQLWTVYANSSHISTKDESSLEH